MKKMITPEELADGKVENIPAISLKVQTTLRYKRKIKFLRIGKKIYYEWEWLNDFIKSSIVEPEKAD